MNRPPKRPSLRAGVELPHGGRFFLGSPVKLILQAHERGQRPLPVRPFAAVIGRSNVGKSSLLNALLGVEAARVSQTPGRTQALFWFRVAETFDLVDCPGYGYAKTGQTVRQQLSELIEGVLTLSPGPSLALLLVDGRIPPQDSDRSMSAFLKKERIPGIVVLTKWDSVKASVRVRQLRALTDEFGSEGWPVHPVSAQTGENLKALVTALRAHLTNPIPASGT